MGLRDILFNRLTEVDPARASEASDDFWDDLDEDCGFRDPAVEASRNEVKCRVSGDVFDFDDL